MLFTKKNLYFDDYLETVDKGDNPQKKAIDKLYLSKRELYEVIYFCNRFLEIYNKDNTLHNFQKVERLLRYGNLKRMKSRSKLNEGINSIWYLTP